MSFLTVNGALQAMRSGAEAVSMNLLVSGAAGLQPEDGEAFAAELKSNTSLTSLSLGDGRGFIGDAGASAIAAALKTNSTLTDLRMQWNAIRGVGATALAQALTINSTLTSLDLGTNYIGDVGATAIANALQTNRVLTSLVLRDNEILPTGAVAIATALESNTTLLALNLNFNNIGDVGANALGDALEINASLTSLNLFGCQIDDAGAISLGEALKTNRTLKRLDLRGNFFGKDGASAIVEGLKANTTLIELDFYTNYIPQKQVDQFRQLISRNRQLAELRHQLTQLHKPLTWHIQQQNPATVKKAAAPSFDVETIFAALNQSKELLDQLTEDGSLDGDLLSDLRQKWLLQVVQFFQRSIAPDQDDFSSLDHSFVKAAFEVLAQMKPEGLHYARAAYELSQHFDRLIDKDTSSDDRAAFRLTALRLSDAAIRAGILNDKMIADEWPTRFLILSQGDSSDQQNAIHSSEPTAENRRVALEKIVAPMALSIAAQSTFNSTSVMNLLEQAKPKMLNSAAIYLQQATKPYFTEALERAVKNTEQVDKKYGRFTQPTATVSQNITAILTNLLEPSGIRFFIRWRHDLDVAREVLLKINNGENLKDTLENALEKLYGRYGQIPDNSCARRLMFGLNLLDKAAQLEVNPVANAAPVVAPKTTTVVQPAAVLKKKESVDDDNDDEDDDLNLPAAPNSELGESDDLKLPDVPKPEHESAQTSSISLPAQ